MSNIKILYASWCNTKGSDKVWGYFTVNDAVDTLEKPVFVFWGARGKALQIKEHVFSDDLVTLKRSKQRKGYEQVFNNDGFLAICPNFYQEVDDKLTFAILSGNKYKAAV